ncbi:MAG: hypothetical protein H7145_05095 [Akkermansiaceae bacterium]|nr:hypothetical protein [Armatimonadota bacterium]
MNDFPSPDELLAALVKIPGPPGQEDAVRQYLEEQLIGLNITYRVDAKGNLLATTGDVVPDAPTAVVTAHMDEIAAMVTGYEGGGGLRVAPLGGLYPWKWGEGPVDVLPLDGLNPVPGVLSFGSIHTTAAYSAAQLARDGKALTWDHASIWTGLNRVELIERGIVPGCRVVMAQDRRRVQALGRNRVGSYFLDDRADCVAWLLALRAMKEANVGDDVLFIATVSEEVGGEGVLFALRSLSKPPTVCVALEIGPSTPDAHLTLDATPTLWISDSYATMSPLDIALVYAAGGEVNCGVQPQAVTRGGSDATLAASRGFCARPVTLAFAAENSHGFEIMHGDAMQMLADLLVAYLRRLETNL